MAIQEEEKIVNLINKQHTTIVSLLVIFFSRIFLEIFENSRKTENSYPFLGIVFLILVVLGFIATLQKVKRINNRVNSELKGSTFFLLSIVLLIFFLVANIFLLIFLFSDIFSASPEMFIFGVLGLSVFFLSIIIILIFKIMMSLGGIETINKSPGKPVFEILWLLYISIGITITWNYIYIHSFPAAGSIFGQFIAGFILYFLLYYPWNAFEILEDMIQINKSSFKKISLTVFYASITVISVLLSKYG